MVKDNKRYALLPIIACALIGAGFLAWRFNNAGPSAAVLLKQPRLIPANYNAGPFIGRIFKNDKPANDAVGIRVTYTNAGLDDAIEVERSTIIVSCRDSKLRIVSVDTAKTNMHRSARHDVIMMDEFYLHKFLPADSQFIYLKFNYRNKAGLAVEPLKELITYTPGQLEHQLPATGGRDYDKVRQLLLDAKLW